jgi:major membrane immunogen (membrane-anchored lipoprotein)
MSRLMVVAAVLVAGLAGCSSADSADSTPPDLRGLWTGTSNYADAGGSAKGGPETLVIEKQDGALLWGYTEYTDIDGSEKKEGVTGTLTDDDGVVLTEKATLWQGEYDDGSLTFVVSWTKGEDNHSAFTMTMTKQ